MDERTQPQPDRKPSEVSPESEMLTELDLMSKDLARALTVYFTWKSSGLLDEKRPSREVQHPDRAE
ncbi:hypothetical protein [Oxynema aestuarii]|jgi:hypothetical protein|uniref:Uncharacterized protein n=1 Tax=Oxynema aestuarii AP17 TaxID=2064643 RepID=A0A6H1U497_9CYAN|nr:hypothetical protein [Oxynema aestuarii]QIZ73256.1 hypothetical protein HCG48_23845 [Oxynema aestuarii AP17]